MKNYFKYLTFLFFLLTPVLMFSQETGKDTVLNYTDINGNKQGKWIKYYENGQKRYEGFFIDDMPQDTFYHYHPNGEMKAVQIFHDDGSSKAKMYWKNSNIAAKGEYNKKRKKNGRWIFYYPRGSVERKVDYVNGKIHGDEITYYKSGDVLMEVEYEDDEKNGEYTFYFKNGQVKEKGFYRDDVRHGEFKFFTPDGKLDKKGIYKEGLRVGEWKNRNDKGDLETVKYVKGERTDRDSLAREFKKRSEWAKEHQEQIKDPEDFKDYPLKFFKNNR